MSELRIKIVMIFGIVMALFLLRQGYFLFKEEEEIEFHQALPEFILIAPASASFKNNDIL